MIVSRIPKTFYSVSGKFGKILLKMALNNNEKICLYVSVKKKTRLWENAQLLLYNIQVSFSGMMRKICIILLVSITADTLVDNLLSYQHDSCCGNKINFDLFTDKLASYR